MFLSGFSFFIYFNPCSLPKIWKELKRNVTFLGITNSFSFQFPFVNFLRIPIWKCWHHDLVDIPTINSQKIFNVVGLVDSRWSFWSELTNSCNSIKSFLLHKVTANHKSCSVESVGAMDSFKKIIEEKWMRMNEISEMKEMKEWDGKKEKTQTYQFSRRRFMKCLNKFWKSLHILGSWYFAVPLKFSFFFLCSLCSLLFWLRLEHIESFPRKNSN